MSTRGSSVLYDAPGPRTVARHRLYSVAAWLLVLVLVASVGKLMYDKGQFDYDLWEPFVTPAYVQALLVDGLLTTLQMAFAAVLLALVFGFVFGVGKMSDRAWLRWPCWVVVEFFRAVPLLLLIIFVFYFFFIGGEGASGRFWSVVIALTLYNGAVLAEVVRAGVLAVPRGQGEAAYALGMSKPQVMVQILLPQAVKIMLPAIISQCVVALKDTSLGYYIVAPGLTAVGKQLWGEFDNQFQAVIVLAALYIAANTVLSAVATWAQRRFVGERRQDGGQVWDRQVVAPTANQGGA